VRRNDDLDDLAERFEKYEELNAVQFTSMLTMLGGRVHASTYDFTAYRLARTASDAWVTPVLGLIAEEHRTGRRGAWPRRHLRPAVAERRPRPSGAAARD
jgi:hypothetical protein